MQNSISIEKAINKAIEIKNNGGLKAIRVDLSNSLEDTINRVNFKSKEIIEKLS